MIPGVGKGLKDIDISDDAFIGIEAMINSMTKGERANPDSIDASRRRRIAKGSGKKIEEVNAFMKQFEQMRQMMGSLNKFKGIPGMGGGFPGMGGGMPGGFPGMPKMPFGRR